MTFERLGALSMFLAVLAGAFGAHALKSRLSPEHLAIWETAVRYQVYHALALLLVKDRFAGWSFVSGTILFSGSLYLRQFFFLTPIGGLLFLLGWGKIVISGRL